MKITITAIIIMLISTTLLAQNTYSVEPGIKDNQIVLELANISQTEEAKNLEIKLIKKSNNIIFNQTEKLIEKITEGTKKEVSFSFDVEYNIGKTKTDTIEFIITDNNTINITRQFIFSYTGPKEYKLEQNYPNPFNPTTKIRYTVPDVRSELAQTVIKVYDILGNEVATLVNEKKEPGYYEVEFNAEGLSSGIYFYRLQSGNPSTISGQNYIQTKKMILLR